MTWKLKLTLAFTSLSLLLPHSRAAFSRKPSRLSGDFTGGRQIRVSFICPVRTGKQGSRPFPGDLRNVTARPSHLQGEDAPRTPGPGRLARSSLRGFRALERETTGMKGQRTRGAGPWPPVRTPPQGPAGTSDAPPGSGAAGRGAPAS